MSPAASRMPIGFSGVCAIEARREIESRATDTGRAFAKQALLQALLMTEKSDQLAVDKTVHGSVRTVQRTAYRFQAVRASVARLGRLKRRARPCGGQRARLRRA